MLTGHRPPDSRGLATCPRLVWTLLLASGVVQSCQPVPHELGKVGAGNAKPAAAQADEAGTQAGSDSTTDDDGPGSAETSDAGNISDGSSRGSSTQAKPTDPGNSSTTTNRTSTATGAETNPATECRPGERGSCSETEGGKTVELPGGFEPIGNCRLGERMCGDQGQWGVCRGLVAPELNDSCVVKGDDANCNGEQNDNCECVSGDERPCGKSSEGSCRLGTQRCGVLGWTECRGNVDPKREVCDGGGEDEDCDGAADLDDSDCECLDNAYEPCTIHKAKGDCALGEVVCIHGKYINCQPLLPGEREFCGKRPPDRFGREATGDEDCDGRVDEDDEVISPLGCIEYMQDDDADGWGAIGPSYHEDKDRATWGCFCHHPPPQLMSWRRVQEAGRANTDCGDCAGDHTDGYWVNPGITFYHAKPSQCLLERNWPHPFDYNCDGRQTRRYTQRRRGECLGTPSVEECYWSESSTGYWAEFADIPDCGEEGPIPACRPAGGSSDHCYRSDERWTEDRPQLCL